MGNSVGDVTELPRLSNVPLGVPAETSEQSLEKQAACKRFLLKLGLVTSDYEMTAGDVKPSGEGLLRDSQTGELGGDAY